MFIPRRNFAIFAVLLATGLAGCAATSIGCAKSAANSTPNNLEPARMQLEKNAKKYGREADNFKLDRAMVELAAGRPKEAERLLREVRDSFDYYEQKSVAEKRPSC